MKKIFFITKSKGFGGAEIHTINLIRELNKNNFKISILCLAQDQINKFTEEEKINNIEIHNKKTSQNIISLFYLLKKNRPDIVIFIKSGFYALRWWIYIIPHLIGVKKIFTIEHDQLPSFIKEASLCDKNRSSIIKKFGWLGRERFKAQVQNLLVTKSIFVSNSIKLDYISYLGLSPAKVESVNNGVNTENFNYNNSSPLRAKLNIPVDNKIITCVSRITKNKGLDILLDAIALIAINNSNFRLVIVGDGPEKISLEKYTNHLKIAHLVNFVGFQKDIPSFLNGSDVFVLPSLNEGMPLALLEAMASNIACITTNVGGIPDVIENGINGYMVTPSDRDKLAALIFDLLTNDVKRKLIGDNARQHIKSNFELNLKMKDLINILVN